MTPDEFAHLLPYEETRDDCGVLRSAGNIRRLVARVRELEAEIRELERIIGVGTRLLAKAEKQRDELAAALRDIIIGAAEHDFPISYVDAVARKALAKLDGKPGDDEYEPVDDSVRRAHREGFAKMRLDEAWEGVMITYTECDFPGSEPYKRSIPGWKCRSCGRQYGTAGAPPRRCDCGSTWETE